jgi:hypothetical protein
MRLRKLLIVSIFFLSTLLVIWVFVMFGTTYQRPYERPSEGCGVTGCGVPQKCIRPSIWEELINWVDGTQYMR